MLLGSSVGHGSAVGGSCRNLHQCERERQFAIEFNLDSMCFAFIRILYLRPMRPNFLSIFITLGEFYVVVFITCTTDMLSMQNKLLELRNRCFHSSRAICTGNSSRKVISRIMPLANQRIGHCAYAHLPAKNLTNTLASSPALSVKAVKCRY